MARVTQQQKDALDALAWLHSNRREERATGRTHVLALNYLRRATQSLNEWVEISDHVETRDASRYMLQVIRALGQEMSIWVDTNTAQASSIRIRIREVSVSARQSLFVDEIDEIVLPRFLPSHSFLGSQWPSDVPQRIDEPLLVTTTPEEPVVTYWERLAAGDD